MVTFAALIKFFSVAASPVSIFPSSVRTVVTVDAPENKYRSAFATRTTFAFCLTLRTVKGKCPTMFLPLSPDAWRLGYFDAADAPEYVLMRSNEARFQRFPEAALGPSQ